jgi:hypothetical protein
VLETDSQQAAEGFRHQGGSSHFRRFGAPGYGGPPFGLRGVLGIFGSDLDSFTGLDAERDEDTGGKVDAEEVFVGNGLRRRPGAPV